MIWLLSATFDDGNGHIGSVEYPFSNGHQCSVEMKRLAMINGTKVVVKTYGSVEEYLTDTSLTVKHQPVK